MPDAFGTSFFEVGFLCDWTSKTGRLEIKTIQKTDSERIMAHANKVCL
jgi:hypothetical protein